jgi:hypothetical protein
MGGGQEFLEGGDIEIFLEPLAQLVVEFVDLLLEHRIVDAFGACRIGGDHLGDPLIDIGLSRQRENEHQEDDPRNQKPTIVHGSLLP